MFAMEQLERDVEWLISKIAALKDTHYFIFDCPGQIELYTHHKSFQSISEILMKRFDFRFSAVHLVDSYYCSDPAMFISVVLTALSAMLRIALPHVNVLSKVDLIERMGKLDFNLQYYTEVMDMGFLVERLQVGFLMQQVNFRRVPFFLEPSQLLVSQVPRNCVNVHQSVKQSFFNFLACKRDFSFESYNLDFFLQRKRFELIEGR